jgi:hypothetical protein
MSVAARLVEMAAAPMTPNPRRINPGVDRATIKQSLSYEISGDMAAWRTRQPGHNALAAEEVIVAGRQGASSQNISWHHISCGTRVHPAADRRRKNINENHEIACIT